MEAVEHAECDDEGHRSYGHSHHRDATDDIDGVGRLPGEEVATGYVEGKIHKRVLLFQQFIDMFDVIE